jgi:hypothetical protein
MGKPANCRSDEREIPMFGPISEARIEVSYRDRNGHTIKAFANVQELAEFLKCNPQLAKVFGYVAKKPKSPEPKDEDPVRDTMILFLERSVLSSTYNSAGLIMCQQKFLIEKISLGYVLTNSGKRYLERLESEK